MSGGTDPGSWVDRLVGWCFGLLVAVVVINCAVALIEQVLPTLLLILGVVGVVIGIIAAVRWWRRDNW